MAKKITIECEVTISDGELTPAERRKLRKKKERESICIFLGGVVSFASLAIFITTVVVYKHKFDAHDPSKICELFLWMCGSFFVMCCALAFTLSFRKPSHTYSGSYPHPLDWYL